MRELIKGGSLMCTGGSQKRIDGPHSVKYSPSAYDEIVHQYGNTINSCCERYEFFIKVLHDYTKYQTSKNLSEKAFDFVINKWTDYLAEFKLDGVTEEIQKGLIQIILYRIIRNRIVIQNIKEGVKL